MIHNYSLGAPAAEVVDNPHPTCHGGDHLE